jgi:penicillin-binding protein-related factor A (putative recombinase)
MTNRVLSGKKAKNFGKLFEVAVQIEAVKNQWKIFKIHDGCEGFGTTLRKRSQPFDFFAVKHGKALFFDAKSTDKTTFAFSQVNKDQLNCLMAIHQEGFKSGYLVHFRQIDRVVFFSSEILMSLKARDSLRPDDGIKTGLLHNHILDIIFSTEILLDSEIKNNDP